MQAYAPSQALQVLGGTFTLLQNVAALLPAAPSRSYPHLQPKSNPVSPPKPFFRGCAAQILTAPTVSRSALTQHIIPVNYPFRPPTAHTPPKSYSRRPQPQANYARTNFPRLLSLSSQYLSIFRSAPHPPPHVLAQISRVEAVANAAPADVPAQIAFYRALFDTGLKQGYDRIVSRWERTLEFDQRNPILRSDDAFQLYLTALVRAGHQSSINNAVQRREHILTLPLPAEPLSPQSPATSPEIPTSTTSSLSPDTSTSSSGASPARPLEATAPLSKSQEIAQGVLASRDAWMQSPSTSFGNNIAKHSSANASALLGSGSGGKENPIHVTISEPKGTTIYRIIRFLALTALGAFFVLVVMAVLLENSGLLKAGPTTAEFEPVQGKTVKFSDVHGVDEAKDELQEVVEFLKDPTNFATLGGKLPKGVLLTGPPGTGKTMLARAVAGEAGVPFLFASGSEFDEMFVGIGAKRIRDLFATARKKQPSIIFIDELDAIGSKRSPKDQHYMKQTLNQLLVELDGFQQTEGVIVIAATNFPQTLDQALVRPGRFDRKISVPLPDVKGRVQILKHHMQNVVTSTDVDPMIIARGTPGFSGADLQNMVNQAAIQASREGCQFVLLRHFEWAKDRIVMGAERRSTYIAPDVKKLTAYHEGGHALVALYTEGAMPLHKVTCMPRGNALGYTSQLPEDDRFSVSFKEFIAEMDCCMGGRVAEELVYGPENVTSGCISDLARATDVATRMVQNYGYSQKVGPVYYDEQDLQNMSPQKRELIETEVRNLVEASQERAKQILTSREEELHRLAEALVEFETLNLEEVQKVVNGEKIRENEDLSQV